MNFSEQCFRIFEQATEAYHVTDNVDATVCLLYTSDAADEL